MEAALDLLEKNKPECNELFREILHNPETRFDAVKKTFTPIAKATYNSKILTKPEHLARYIRLVILILEHKPHREHLNIEEWAVLAQFLVAAYDHLRSALEGLPFVKSTHEIFQGLSLLLSTIESCNSTIFPSVSSICRDFLELNTRRETLCHPYIMKCLRILTSLGFDDATEIAGMLLSLERFKNPMFVYEINLFACLKPQPLETLADLNPQLIPSNAIEFIPAPEYGSCYFRPSCDADLNSYVAALALSSATSDWRSSSESPAPHKRQKTRGSIVLSDGFRYMVDAFRAQPIEDVESVLDRLKPESRSRHSTSVVGPDYQNSYNTSESLSSDIFEKDSDSGTLRFWAFTLLGRCCNRLPKTQMHILWNSCLESLQSDESSSGACFCLANLATELLKPVNIDGVIVNKIKSLLSVLGGSSYPCLSSGSLCLYACLLRTKVIDEEFQSLIFQQSRKWLVAKIQLGSPKLLAQLFDDACPPAYLHSDIAKDIKDTVALARTNEFISRAAQIQKLTGPSLTSDLDLTSLLKPSKPLKSSCLSFTALTKVQPRSLKDSIWSLSLLARSGHRVTRSSQSRIDAFTDEDLQAFIWFANLATYFLWDDSYCREVLALASWDLPAKSSESVEKALALLESSKPVVSALRCGFWSPKIKMDKMHGSELRAVEPFLKSYRYQRSPSVLRNLSMILRLDTFQKTDEAKQLRAFLLKVCSTQSEFSTLIWFTSVPQIESEFLKQMQSQDDLSKLRELLNREHESFVSSFSEKSALDFAFSFDRKMRVAILSALYFNNLIGLTQLCLAMTESDTKPEDLDNKLLLLGVEKSSRSIASLLRAPLLFSHLHSRSYSNVMSSVSSNSKSDELTTLCDLEAIDSERSDDYLSASTAFLLKECAYAASDLEVSHAVEKLFKILQAHRTKLSDSLLIDFLKNTLALFRALKVRKPEPNQWKQTYGTLSSLINLCLKDSESLELRYTVCLLLREADCFEDAAKLLELTLDSESSHIYHMICGFSSLTLESIPHVWKSIDDIELSLEYELRRTALWHFSEAVRNIDSSLALNSLSVLDDTSAKKLIEWTSYVPLPHSDTWLATIGRLAASRNNTHTEIHMEQSDYAISLPKGSLSNDVAGFRKVLYQVYQQLPYSKKWLLHTFLRECGWKLHAEHVKSKTFKPQDLEPEDFYMSSQIDPLHGATYYALKILDLPHLDSNTLIEVLELFQEAVPTLIAAAFGSEGRNQKLAEFLHLRDSLRVGLLSSFALERTLRVLRKCYIMCHKLVMSSPEIAEACEWHHKITGSPKFVEFGILAVELAWNESPSEHITSNLQKCLNFFYEASADDALHGRVTLDPTQERSLSIMLKRDNLSNPWENLEFDMAHSEACAQLKLPDSTGLTNSFRSAGLWNLSHRAYPNTDFYDFEKAWWLQQWDATKFYWPRKSNAKGSFKALTEFENTEYAAMIGYMTSRFSEDEVYADLVQTRGSVVRIFENIQLSANDFQACSRFKFKLDDDKDDAVVRFGQEALLLSKGKVFDMASCLAESCEHYRKIGKLNQMLQCTMKLNQLQMSLVDDLSYADGASRQSLNWISSFQIAKTQWSLGRHSQAIESLKHLVDSQEHQNVELADAFALLGTWSREARDERDDAILKNFFLPAVELTSAQNSERVHHLYARFCDDACHDVSLLSAIEDSARVKENERIQSQYLAKAIQSGSTDKAYQNRYRVSSRMLKAETESLELLKGRRLELTLKCIQAYLTSLRYGDNYEEDMSRFVALWLELCETKEVNRLVLKTAFEIMERPFPLHKFTSWINQLSSRLGSEDTNGFQITLRKVITQTAVMHPFHSIWPLINILRTKTNSDKSSQERKSAAKEVVRYVSEKLPSVVLHTIEFADRMAQLGIAKHSGEDKTADLSKLVSSSATHWWKSRLPKMRLPVPIATIPISYDGDYSNVPYVDSANPEIEIAGGISAPKIMTMTDSQGSIYKMVLKGSERDDLRQDAIMQQVFRIAHGLLAKTPSAKVAKKLRVRTYNVIPLGGTCGAIEFVRNTKSLQDILEPLHILYGGDSEYSLRKARHVMHAKRDFNTSIRVATFEDVMAHTKPQMRHFWTKRFRDPHDWIMAKTNWCRSTAVTSILGYIVGLGDRHCSNLLVDTSTGEVVHIDLGIAFDQGKQLYIPETVPFRLTRDMVDGMGIAGTTGVFTSTAEATLQVMREQREQIMTVIEVLKHDALYTWRLPPLRLNKIQSSSDQNTDGVVLEAPRVESGLAEHALRGVRQKLAATLSCEAMVRDLTAQAQSTENLALIFSGWSPFY